MFMIPPGYWGGGNSLEYECPWLTPGAVQHLDRVLNDPSYTVLEHGCGGSTLFFARRCASVISLETDPAWYTNTQKALKEKNLLNCALHLITDETKIPDILVGHQFDVLLIDCYQTISRHNRTLLSIPHLKPGALIILDNYDAGPDTGGLCGRTIDALFPGRDILVYDDEHWVGKGTKIFQIPGTANDLVL